MFVDSGTIVNFTISVGTDVNFLRNSREVLAITSYDLVVLLDRYLLGCMGYH